VASVWSMWGGSTAQTVTASSSKRTVTLAVPEADGVKVTQAAARREIRLIGRGGGPVWSVGSADSAEAGGLVKSGPGSMPKSGPGSGPAVTQVG
jgi:hypothetical protein